MKYEIGSICVMNNRQLAVIVKYDEVYTLRWTHGGVCHGYVFTHSEGDLIRWDQQFGKIVSFKWYIDAVSSRE